jgi:hypothetical protein
MPSGEQKPTVTASRKHHWSLERRLTHACCITLGAGRGAHGRGPEHRRSVALCAHLHMIWCPQSISTAARPEAPSDGWTVMLPGRWFSGGGRKRKGGGGRDVCQGPRVDGDLGLDGYLRKASRRVDRDGRLEMGQCYGGSRQSPRAAQRAGKLKAGKGVQPVARVLRRR